MNPLQKYFVSINKASFLQRRKLKVKLPAPNWVCDAVSLRLRQKQKTLIVSEMRM